MLQQQADCVCILQAVSSISQLTGAKRLAIVCEGLLSLLHYDSLTGHPVQGLQVRISVWHTYEAALHADAPKLQHGTSCSDICVQLAVRSALCRR